MGADERLRQIFAAHRATVLSEEGRQKVTMMLCGPALR